MPKSRTSCFEKSRKSDLAQASCRTTPPVVTGLPVMVVTRLRALCKAARESLAAQRCTKVRLSVVRRALKVEHKLWVLRYLSRRHVRTKHFEFAEMDDGKDGEQIKCVPASNVTLQAHADDSKVKLNVRPKIFKKISAGDDLQDYAHLTDRWMEIGGARWTTDNSTNDSLFDMSLPYDAIVKKEGSSNFAMFPVHQYGRFDMEIRAQLNCTKFHVGSAQMSWYYCDEEDRFASKRNEVASCSQLPNAVLDCSASNDGVITIPYKHYQTFISVKNRNDMAPPMALGRFRMLVLNPLRVADGSSNEAHISLFIRFTACDFMGMTHTKMGKIKTQAEMLPMIAYGAAHALLNQAMQDPNRDRPPYQGSRMAVIPEAQQSMCLADQLTEPLNSLRLDARGQTPHPELVDGTEMSIKNIVSRYMLISQITWSADHAAEKELTALETSPMMQPDLYWNTKVDGKDVFEFPPVAVISALFGAWRGRLNYKFQFISSPYHTGRLRFTYIPHHLDEPTYEQISSCAGVYFDLGAQREFLFETPYMSSRPFWPHRLSTGVDAESYAPPGKVYVHIVNPLRVSSNMPNSVMINVYISAADDFEVGIPVQPSIGLGWDCSHFNPNRNSFVLAAPGYFPYFVSWWRFAKLNGQYKATFASGSATGDIANFMYNTKMKLRWGAYYEFEKPVVWSNLKAKLKRADNTEITPETVYLLPYTDKDYLGLAYFLIYESVDDIVKDIYKKEGATWNLIPQANCKYTLALQWSEDSGYLPANPHLVGTSAKPPKSDSESSFEFAEVGDERFTAASTSCLEVPPPALNVSGEYLWGEKFTDLKSLLRRYQPYLTFTTKLTKTIEKGELQHILNFPVLPQGLDQQYATDPSASTRRDGIIPIIASGYRFYRGSINFKFIFMTSNNCTFYIQHKPDRACLHAHMSVGGRTDMDVSFNHGYSTVFVNTRINNVATVNVPYYQYGAYGLLQRPNPDLKQPNRTKNMHFGLGQIYIYADSCIYQDFTLRVFYSVGDDMRFEEFVGFPRMCIVKDFEKQGADKVYEEFEMAPPRVIDGVLEEQAPPSDERANIITGTFINMGTGVREATEEQPRQERPTTQSRLLKWFSQPLVDEMAEAYKELRKSFNLDVSLGSLVNLMVSHLAHIAISPTWGHVAVMVASVLVELGVVVYENLAAFASSLDALLCRKLGIDPEQEPEGPDDGNIGVDIAALLVTGVAALCQIKEAQLSGLSITQLASKIVKVITTVGRGHIGIAAVCRSIFNIVMQIIEKIKKHLCRDRLTQYWLASTPDIVQKYYAEASKLLDPTFEETLLTSPTHYAILDTTVYVGSLLFRDLTMGDRKVKVVSTLLQVQSRLLALRDRCHKNNIAINKRREPYCVHFTGEHGIGKSQLSESVVDHLLTQAGAQRLGPQIYVHTAGSKHWDGYVNQPAILLDDLRIMKEPNAEVEEFTTIFKLKSCAPFRPPMAELQDKGRFCAPEILVINSNVPYPSSNVLGVPQALYRRYDDCIEVRLKKEVYDKMRNISDLKNLDLLKKEFKLNLAEFEHLVFLARTEPWSDKSPFSDPMNYQELKVYLAKRFNSFRQHQFDIVRNQQQVYPGSEESCASALKQYLQERSRDPVCFELYKRAIAIFSPVPDVAPDDGATMAEMVGQIFEMDDQQPSTSKAGELQPSTSREGMIETQQFPPRYATLHPYPEPKYESLDEYVQLSVQGARHTQRDCLKALARLTHTIQDRGFKEFTQPQRDHTICLHTYSLLSECTYDFDTQEFVSLSTGARYPQTCKDKPCAFVGVNIETGKMVVAYLNKLPSWNLLLRADPFIFFEPESGRPNTMLSPESFRKLLEDGISDLHMWNKVGRLNTLRGFFRQAIFPLLSLIGLIVGVRTVARGARDTVKWLARGGKKELNPAQVVYSGRKHLPEIIPSGDNRTVGARAARRGLVRRIPERVQGAGFVREEAEMASPTALYNCIRRNTFHLVFTGTHIETKEFLRTEARCLGICDHFAVIPRHYMVFLLSLDKADRKCQYFLDTGPIEINLRALNRWEIEEDELCVVELPKQIPIFRDIRNHFMSFDKITGLLPREAVFVEVHSDRTLDATTVQIEPKEDVEIAIDGVVITLTQAIGYNYNGKGKCGSVVLTPADGGKILSMHVSGMAGRGTGSYLYREMFSMANKEVLQTNDFDAILESVTSGGAPPNKSIDACFVDLGTVDKILSANQSGESCISKNLLFNVFTPTTDVAILSKTHPLAAGIDPLEVGTEKQGRPSTNIDPEMMEMAVEDYTNGIYANVHPLTSEIRPLTVMEAVRGVKALNLKPLELKTSEGFPWSSMRPKGASNKKWLFNKEEDEIVGIHPSLANAILHGIRRREELEIQPTIFTNTLKDARLPLAKIRPEKTRVISCAPVDFTIVARMYFSPFFSAWGASRFEHAVGIAVQKQEWSELGQKMSAFSPYHLCGDYSSFGDTLDPNLLYAAFMIATDWLLAHERRFLPEEVCMKNRRVRLCLCEESIHCIRLVGNMLLQAYCGQPSGHPFTVELNSIVGNLYLRLNWLMCFVDMPHFQPLNRLHENVLMKVYGDDAWFAVKELVIKFFNNITMEKNFAKMGIKYTDASKGRDVLSPYSTFSEVTFLKCKFVPHPYRKGNFLAGLEKGSVTDCAMWSKNIKNNQVESTQESAYACLMLAYGWGPEYFGHIRSVLQGACRARGIDFTPRTWSQIDKMYNICDEFQRSHPEEYIDFSSLKELTRMYEIIAGEQPNSS